MHKTLIQWHESGQDGKPLRWHEAGEIADLSHVADVADLERIGTVVVASVDDPQIATPEKPEGEVTDAQSR